MSIKGSDNVPKTKLAYLKSIAEALKTYNDEHDVLNFELVQKIYGYTNNLDTLTPSEKQELDEFIAENTISIKHLANIYLDKKGEEDLSHRLNRMLPIQITKPQSNIKFLKGKENELIEAMHQENMVKVLCKTRKKWLSTF